METTAEHYDYMMKMILVGDPCKRSSPRRGQVLAPDALRPQQLRGEPRGHGGSRVLQQDDQVQREGHQAPDLGLSKRR